MGGEGSTPLTLLSRLTKSDVGNLYPEPADRIAFYLYRTPEELYDVQNDPACLNNLAGDPAYEPILQRFREAMLDVLKSNDDHELANYQRFLDDASE